MEERTSSLTLFISYRSIFCKSIRTFLKLGNSLTPGNLRSRKCIIQNINLQQWKIFKNTSVAHLEPLNYQSSLMSTLIRLHFGNFVYTKSKHVWMVITPKKTFYHNSELLWHTSFLGSRESLGTKSSVPLFSHI